MVFFRSDRDSKGWRYSIYNEMPNWWIAGHPTNWKELQVVNYVIVCPD